MHVERFPENPIIRPGMDVRMDTPDGPNINGPSLMRVPEWLPGALGRYYLYFAHHNGDYIRLAYSDALAGPWRTYERGVLDLTDAFFDDHIASPDVHIDEERRELHLYYHGKNAGDPRQFTRAAVAGDGLRFTAREEVLGAPYMRRFCWDGYYYGLAMPGIFYRSRDPLSCFERGPTLFSPQMRHCTVSVRESTLHVYYTDAGACPEAILYSTIDLTPDWHDWRETPPRLVLAPETPYEGADLELAPSKRGAIMERVRQLRDPYLYEEDGRAFLLYSCAGESGIAIAEIHDWP